MLRIVAGLHRGRRLKTLPGRDTRPTSDRLRESLFSILGDRVAGSRAADLFAGSGALGLEAISRGAANCLFVEKNRLAAEVIKENITALGVGEAARLMIADVDPANQRLLQAGPMDLVLADPPYARGFLPRLAALAAGPFLAAGGLMVVEHHQDEPFALEDLPAVSRQRAYGKTLLSFIEKS